MYKPTLAVVFGGAMLSLAACGSDHDADDDSTTVIETPAPAVTETTVVTDGETPDAGNTVSVGPGGVSADIKSGDTSVKASTDGGVSATVKTD